MSANVDDSHGGSSSLGDSTVELLEKLIEDSGNGPTSTWLDPDKPHLGWRYCNSYVKNMMIISSYGNRYPSNITVTCKLVDGTRAEPERLTMMGRMELDLLLDLYQGDRDTHISFVCCEYPGVQLSKQYYWNRIRKFFMNSPDGGEDQLVLAEVLSSYLPRVSMAVMCQIPLGLVPQVPETCPRHKWTKHCLGHVPDTGYKDICKSGNTT